MATDTTRSEAPDAYAELLERYGRISSIQDAGGVLSWDQQVIMPEGGTPARSRQLSALSATGHELLTAEEFGDALDSAEASDLDASQEAAVREIRREYERSVRVDTDLVERISQTTSEALPVWTQAKDEDDFEAFAPILEDLVELKREYANQIDPDADPYAVLFADYEPYLGLDTAEQVLERLRDELVPLIDEIEASNADLATPFSGTYSEADQEALARDILDSVGYDWDRGRLDVSAHPFTSGNQFDARITTRFDEADPLGALTSTIHEFGHATYALGLPEESYGTPLGEARDLSVHESQSRLWENHVGRSEPFWELLAPEVEERLGVEATPRDFYEAANRIYPDNRIRVEADELTYHMHIVLRFEIERDLISGDLAVEDIPQVWNEKMEEYLGVVPDNDAEGCLQDIHWSHGSFGYFPTYSLGSVLAAQLYGSADREIEDLEGDIEAGEFDALQEWLTENVHRHGKRYRTPELVEEATGEEYSADAFLEYATEKFAALYDL
ncbi:carboxypeptidase [Halobacteriales archaeon QH_8_64_26]|nr:MAG: carboxypeptidase [Halobacteriales archaeon QH_8_64_26]